MGAPEKNLWEHHAKPSKNTQKIIKRNQPKAVIRSKKMSEIPVYCKHDWEEYGPRNSKTWRCLICRKIWKEFESPNPPEFIIGYVKKDKEK